VRLPHYFLQVHWQFFFLQLSQEPHNTISRMTFCWIYQHMSRLAYMGSLLQPEMAVSYVRILGDGASVDQFRWSVERLSHCIACLV
jgi:hypothetical protein